MRDDICIGCLEVGAFAESDADDVSVPRYKVEVRAVDHAWCIQDAFGGGEDASGFGGGGAVGGGEDVAGVEGRRWAEREVEPGKRGAVRGRRGRVC